MKNFMPKNLREKMIVLTIIFVTVPVLVSGYITKTIAEENLLKEKELKLFGVSHMLEQHIQQDFNQILKEQGALDADRSTKINVLNKALNDFTDSIAKAYPGIGVGYYVKDLDAIVTYGPSGQYADKVGVSIDATHPGRRVLETGLKRVEVGQQVRGPIMNAMNPIIRHGDIIGYAWANELTDDVEAQLYEMDKILFIGSVLGMLFIIFLLIWFWDGVIYDVGLVKEGLRKMRYNLHTRIHGADAEIKEIADAVNEMADSLLHARTLTENVMESIEDGVITVDIEGNVTSMNQAAMEMTGILLEDAAGKPYIDTFLKGKSFNSILLETLQTGVSNIGVEMNYPVNGRTLFISASAYKLRDSYGNTIGAVVTMKDLSEKKQLEEQVNRADRLAALGELMAGVAHEVRNPLTGIKSFAQYLQEGSTEEERREFFPLIIKEVDRVNKIIEELLYFARPCDANITPVNVNLLLEQTLLLVKNSAANRIKFNMQLEENLTEVAIDPEQFKQVFLNLLINSIQAIEETGEITIESRLNHERDKVQLIFSDTGVGIKEDNLDKVFDPFYTSKKTGTGLGLAVVQRIIAAHNGSIILQNNTSGGAQAIIEIPIHQPEQEGNQ